MNMNLEAELKHSSLARRHRLTSEEESDEEARDAIDLKPLSVEVGEASTLMLLGAEQENAELRRRLEELQEQREAESPLAKDELASLEAEHQSTLREAGVGEEGLHLLDGGRGEAGSDEGKSAKDRGQAEGGQGQRGKESPSKLVGEIGGGASTQDIHTAGASVPHLEPQHRAEDGEGETSPDPSAPDTELVIRLREAREEADSQALLAQELRSKLGEQSRRAWEAEQRLVLLDIELQRLRKAAEGLGEARRQIEVQQTEALAMEEELCRLRSHQELHAMQSTVIASLEGERASLERERDALRSSVESLRTAQRKGHQSELSNQSLRAELERQGRSLEASRRREAELEGELREAALEAEGLARGRDQALLDASRLEREKEACGEELEGQQKEGRQRERQAARLRQQLESTALALEQLVQEMSDCRERCAGLQGSEKELGARLDILEEERRRLYEQYTDSQSHVNSLSQDLSNEQGRASGLSDQMVQLNRNLSAVEDELRATREALSGARERTQLPSRFVEGSDGVAEAGAAGGPSAGVPSSASSRPDKGPPETETQSGGRDPAKGGDPGLTRDDLSTETEKQPGQRLTELQQQHAAVLAEREALLFRASEAQEACQGVREEMEALRRHALSLQDSCTKLQALNTQLQVDHGMLSSQHASALTRFSASEARCAALEAESKVWAREREESCARTEAMRRDQERMAALQQRQEAELEELLDKHSQLRTYKELLEDQAQLVEREREVQVRRELMDAEHHRRAETERELERTKEDYERLQTQHREWLGAQAELLAQGSVLRAELNGALLERTRLEGELSTLRGNNQNLDLCNLLTQLKGNMEEENRHLAEQSQSLLKENRALLEQSLERRDLHHTEQREYQEKLGELRREKQKLVEKILDQYRVLEPSAASPASKAKKSNWIADRMKKLINRRSPGETEISAPRSPVLLTGPMARRKLGSRHGWGLGLARAGSLGLSHSFSPGDQRLRARSSPHGTSAVSWERSMEAHGGPTAALP
ncbi:hypothetical protein NHX12_011585, partial [Muraenolepis orangiensis]